MAAGWTGSPWATRASTCARRTEASEGQADREVRCEAAGIDLDVLLEAVDDAVPVLVLGIEVVVRLAVRDQELHTQADEHRVAGVAHQQREVEAGLLVVAAAALLDAAVRVAGLDATVGVAGG